jgi:uncharacterized protein YjiS (DUF1127 family)
MIEFKSLAVMASWAAAWRAAPKRLPHISDHMLRDIGFTRACVADSRRGRSPVLPFGPFGLPIEF